jgi:hypothetical protein
MPDVDVDDLGALAELITRDTFAVVVVTFDAGAPSGWRTNVQTKPWVNADAIATILRRVADQYDPPAVLDLVAEHHPECTCEQCTAKK